MELKTVQSEDIKSIWPEIVHLLNRLVEYDEDVILEEIFSSLVNKKQQLWLAVSDGIKALAVTEINQRPKQKVCLIYGISGDDMGSWIHFLPVIERWALSIGCDSTELMGRRGWERKLKTHGWELTKVVIRKKLHG